MTINRVLLVVSWSIPVLFSAGCDTGRKIDRTVPLQKLLPKDTVEAALRDVPEIESVDYRRVEARTALSQNGFVHDPPYDQFFCRSARTACTVEVQQTATGVNRLNLYCFWVNQRPDPQTVKETRSLLDKVYTSLRARAPDLPPEGDVKETLMGIKE